MPFRQKRTVPERLAERAVMAPSGCWQWTGTVTPKGYGQMSVGGRRRYTHRLAYEQYRGSVPAGLEIDHLCRNRACLNPAHLEAVTHAVNNLRGSSLSAVAARQTSCRRGHPYNAINTRLTAQGYRQCRVCDRENKRRVPSEQGAA